MGNKIMIVTNQNTLQQRRTLKGGRRDKMCKIASADITKYIIRKGDDTNDIACNGYHDSRMNSFEQFYRTSQCQQLEMQLKTGTTHRLTREGDLKIPNQGQKTHMEEILRSL